MPNMVPPDYGSNTRIGTGSPPDPGLEPVSPHIALNRYQTRKTQRKRISMDILGAATRRPGAVNYAVPALSVLLPKLPEIGFRSRAPLGPGRRAQGHGNVWWRLRPPT